MKLALYILVVLLIGCTGNTNETTNEMQVKKAFENMNTAHKCRWDLCPYKGITLDKASKVVANYVGSSGVDAYYIDMLHIQYPTLDADQLDSLLTIKHH